MHDTETLLPPHLHNAIAVFKDHTGLVPILKHLLIELRLDDIVRATVAFLPHIQVGEEVDAVLNQPLEGILAFFLTTTRAEDSPTTRAQERTDRKEHIIVRTVLHYTSMIAVPILGVLTEEVCAMPIVGDSAVNIHDDVEHLNPQISEAGELVLEVHLKGFDFFNAL